MGLDTSTPTTLWKDRAMVEANIAVLHSFQSANITIVDHHTASETFMKHFENESRLRNGCPADWVWIVPPMSGSATPVFHQEMMMYFLRPSYEYQEPAWKTHEWKKQRDPERQHRKARRKFHFKQIARAVRFATKLFGRALLRRIKATVLYATETGKSESFAKILTDILSHSFNAQMYSMSEYDITSIEHEALLLVVTSTSGNGDPPENGQEFFKHLQALQSSEEIVINTGASKRKFSIAPPPSLNVENSLGTLSNVRFAVFALGSSAYPNFCCFGKQVDQVLDDLGAERILKVGLGDEMCGQQQAFKKWSSELYKVSCDAFCLDNDSSVLDSSTFNTVKRTSMRFVPSSSQPLETALTKCYNKNVNIATLKARTNLYEGKAASAILNLVLATDINYSPGDHVGIFGDNRSELVDGILRNLSNAPDPDSAVELQCFSETNSLTELQNAWIAHEKIPSTTLRTLFQRFLDITTTPTPNLLQDFAQIASDEADKKKLLELSSDSGVYEEWRHSNCPNLFDVLEEFRSVKPSAAQLVGQLSILQPRFYSISSSKLCTQNEVHLTVAVVQFIPPGRSNVTQYGVCSNYLNVAKVGSQIHLFVRSAPNFHLPADNTEPLILVGPGTGIAPFRSFWQHRRMLQKRGKKLGKCLLFFGCREKVLDLYPEEKAKMVDKGTIYKTYLALSRQVNIRKTYVQDIIEKEDVRIYKLLIERKGHFYVCGDVTMANDVYQTVKRIIMRLAQKTAADAESILKQIRKENRYHEDIFGITLRTAEVHNKSRQFARIRNASEAES